MRDAPNLKIKAQMALKKQKQAKPFFLKRKARFLKNIKQKLDTNKNLPQGPDANWCGYTKGVTTQTTPSRSLVLLCGRVCRVLRTHTHTGRQDATK